MNTDLGYLAVDSQIDMLEDCCTGRCNENQGRGECDCQRRMAQEGPSRGFWALFGGSVIAAAVRAIWGAL